MIWFFERDDQELRVETRQADDTGEYLLVICWPDGDQCERFSDPAKYRARLVEVEGRLEADRWARARGPIIAPDGLRRQS